MVPVLPESLAALSTLGTLVCRLADLQRRAWAHWILLGLALVESFLGDDPVDFYSVGDH